MKVTKDYLKKLIRESLEAEGVKVDMGHSERGGDYSRNIMDSEKVSENFGVEIGHKFTKLGKIEASHIFRVLKSNVSNGKAHAVKNLDAENFVKGFRKATLGKRAAKAIDDGMLTRMFEKAKNKALEGVDPETIKGPRKIKGSMAAGGGAYEDVYGDYYDED